MSRAAAQPPRALKIVIIVLIAVGLIGSPIGLWVGVDTILADRRIQAGAITAEARIVSLQAPRSGTISNPQTARPGYVRYELLSRPGRTHDQTVDTETWRGLAVGQVIAVHVDPSNPDRHILDRRHELRVAWLYVLGFGVGLLLSLGLAVWAFRGGLSPAQARG